jgi:Fibronectin type III domain
VRKNISYFYFVIVFLQFVLTGCDFNLLGGKKSELSENFEPGKRTESNGKPVINLISDFTMDENDIQSVSFQISDPDSFLMCSSIYLKVKSNNTTLIDYNQMTIGGVFPNCVLRLSPKAFQFGTSQLTVELYDFWTIVSTTFTLNVVHVLTPGPFSIIDAEGQDRAVGVTWTVPTNMSGTSARYTVYYRETGSASGWSQITPVASPYTVSGLINGQSYDFFIRAKNSIGFKDSNIVQATPTKYKLRGVEFVAGTNQFGTTTPSGPHPAGFITNATLVSHIDTSDANYPGLVYSTNENPVNTSGTSPSSYLTTPSGNYHVYMDSQQNIISGAGQ